MDTQTINTYNKLAEEYDEETITFWEKFPISFIDTFIKHAQGSILDIGSGPGRDGLILKEKGLTVTCLDASESMIKLCRERGLNALIGDFNHLPFENSSFDGIWAYTSLLHVSKKDIHISLQEIHRVLIQGGVFGLGMIEGNWEGYRESSGVNLPRWFSFYTREEIESLLTEYDFEIIYFEIFKPRDKSYLNFIARKK